MTVKRDVWSFNFASLKKVRDRVQEELAPRLSQIRHDRKELEDHWEEAFNMWDMKHDDHHTYMGRAKLYIPEVRKNVESQARQLTEAAMPNEDFFDVSPGLGGTKRGAKIRKSIARWQIEQAQLRTKLHVFNRQEVMFGTSPVYIPWTERTNRVLRRARNKQGKIEIKRETIKEFCGPDFITRDLFRWFALNPTKASHKEDGCFEDYTLNYFELLARKKKGQIAEEVWQEILESSSEAYQMEEMEKFVRRVEEMGLMLNSGAYTGKYDLSRGAEKTELERMYLTTPVFLPMVLPEACESDEDKEMPIPVQVTLYNGKVAQVIRNPFWHQSDPYLVGKYILPNVDEFYGQGLPKAIKFMQHELNSTAEQTMDSKTLALNPLAAIDPGLAAQLNDFEIHPGAKWFVRPDGIKLFNLPDLSGTGYAAMAQLRSQMQEYSDRTPALPPQMQGKARTATQADIVERAYTIDLKSFQLQNEIMVLQPAMKMWEFLTDQNIEDDQVIMILGRRSSDWRRKMVSKESILGSYEYFWKATSTVQNKPVKARQMLDLIKVSGSLPPEAQAKLAVNYSEFFKILWTEMFELPDADKVFGFMAEEMQSQDPEVEHKMLELGMEIEVLPGDNDREHMISHDKHGAQLKEGSFEQKSLMIHMLLHQRQEERKIQLQQQRQAMMQMQMMMAQQQQQSKQGSSQGSGNRTQMSPNANAGDMASGMRA